MFFKNLIAKLKSERGEAGSAANLDSESGANPSRESGEKLEGLIGDIDFSDIDEKIRGTVKALVATKVKNYDAGFRTKSEEIKEIKQKLEDEKFSLRELQALKSEIEGNPELSKAVQDLINKARAGQPIVEKKVDKSLSTLDQLISQANDAEQREQLQKMRKIIKEETASGVSKDEVDKLYSEIASLKKVLASNLVTGIESQVSKLKDEFGKDLVGKYEKDIRAAAQKYPDYLSDDKFAKLLFTYASKDEISNALFEAAKHKKQIELKRKQDSAFPDTASKPLELDYKRDKAGRVIWGDVIRQGMDKLGIK